MIVGRGAARVPVAARVGLGGGGALGRRRARRDGADAGARPADGRGHGARARPARATGRGARAIVALAASPLVIGTGLFILLFPLADPVALALPVTALVNAALSLPFALRALVPALARSSADYGRLADGLGLRGAAALAAS